jgi:flagellar hook protein FlgE
VGPLNVTNGRIRLDNIPAPTGEFTVPPSVMRIYRNTDGQSTTYYRIAEINPGTTVPSIVYVDSAADSAITSNPTLDFDGPKITTNTLLTDVVRRDGSSYDNLFGLGTLTFVGEKGGANLAPKTLTIAADTTVNDLLEFMDQAYGIQNPVDDDGLPIVDAFTGDAPGGYINNGRIRFVSNNGTGNALGVDSFLFTPSGTTDVDTPDLGFTTTQDAKGQSAVANFIVYDSLGIPLQVTVTAVLESRNSSSTTYRWYATSRDNDPDTGVETAVGTGTIKFDGDGKVIDFADNTVSIDRRNISSNSPLRFDLDFSKLSGLAANKSSLSATRQDGSDAGTLSSYIIGEDGIIRGVYTNGIARSLGQILLARFANPAGLDQRGENLFGEGVNSGLPITGSPGSQGIGSIISGATELSNTDIGRNLIDLILASSQYRGNTRVITTAQQLLDELLNLRR